MLWKIAAIKAFKFALAVFLAASIRFFFVPGLNWWVQIVTTMLLFGVSMPFFYIQEKKNQARK